MKRVLLFLFAAICAANSLRAYDFKSGDLCYDIIDKDQVEVVNSRDTLQKNRLISVVIPETVRYNGNTYSVTSIGEAAFNSCKNLTSVTIHYGVKNIKEYAFGGCSSLTSVTISYGVKTIGRNAFAGCSGLTSITIPNSVTSIGGYAFYGCTGLTAITIPNSVTSIGDYAFYGCSGLTSITIPNSVTSIGGYAFYGCSGLTSITIPNSVTSIGGYAFYGCTGLTAITIPNSVTSIGSDAFNGCSSLTSVTISYGVKTIGRNAFAGCSGLTSVTIPNSVTSIGESVFSGCSGLTSVTIGNSVTSIGKYVFYGCTELTSIVIASQNSVYDSRDNCNAIIATATKTLVCGCKNTIIPNSVTSIGWDAFYGCTGLTSITIPESVTSIRSSAFYGCTGLTSITIPESVTSIGDSAFFGCSGFTSITIPNSVTSIERSAFNNVLNIVYYGTATGTPWGAKAVNGYTDGYFVYKDERQMELLGCSLAAKGDIVIPNSVMSIGERAFRDCSDLTSVVWLQDMDMRNQLDSNAVYFVNFDHWSNIHIHMWGGSKEWTAWPGVAASKADFTYKGYDVYYFTAQPGDYAYCIFNNGYSGSANQTEDLIWKGGHVYFGKNNTLSSCIGRGAFLNCTGLTSVTIGEGVTSIDSSAFRGCTGLTSITIPNSVMSIESGAFSGCSGLTSVTIGNSVTSIGGGGWPDYGAFNGCSGLTSVTIPNSVTSIGDYAFYGCSGLTSVTIPNSVTSIGKSVFSGCSGLTSVTIPDGVTSIGNYAFYDCTDLISITIGNGVTSIGKGSFEGCSGLTSITIGNGVTSIGKSSFEGCSGLTSITIGNGVTTIGDYAFYGCTGLTSIIIPDSVTSIGEGAFKSCTDLTSITIGKNVTSIGKGICDNCSNLTDVIWNAKNCSDFSYSYEDGCNAPFNSIASQITSVRFGNEVERIPNYLCYKMSGISSCVISKSVTSIGSYAFKECSALTSFTIGEQVENIAEGVFIGCTNLKSMILKTLTPPQLSSRFESDTFEPKMLDNMALYIPCGTRSAYIPVTGWSYFKHIYERGSFDISVKVNDPQMGMAQVDNGPTCSMEATISATPKTGYQFSGWNDGNTDNPRTIVLTQDTTLTARFEIQTYKVTLFCDSEEGITIGGGTYQYGDTVSISATPKTGYRFVRWSDGNKNTLRTIVLTQDISLTAIFEMVTYDITLSYDAEQGTVSGGGTYQEGKQVSVSATPKTGYRFVRWSDGNTDNPRTIVLTQDISLTAIFEMVTCDITLSCDADQGSVSGGGTYQEGKQVSVSATPKTGYRFTHWNDGNTDNPRTIVLTQDTVLTAYFEEIPTYAVSLSCDAKQGTVSGGGTYREGEQVSVSATPKTGYRFTQWSDGNTDNPRTIVLTQDTALTAIFEMVMYEVSLSCDAKQGTVSGGGTYQEGKQVTIFATPNKGYVFVHWSDGNTGNPRSWIVTEDVTLSAIFQQITALPQTTAASQETQKVVKDGQVLILRNGKAYNMLGQEIR